MFQLSSAERAHHTATLVLFSIPLLIMTCASVLSAYFLNLFVLFGLIREAILISYRMITKRGKLWGFGFLCYKIWLWNFFEM
jgi:hypothetical protein